MTDDPDETIDTTVATEPTTVAATTYRPLPSVWEGSDAALLERMLDF